MLSKAKRAFKAFANGRHAYKLFLSKECGIARLLVLDYG